MSGAIQSYIHFKKACQDLDTFSGASFEEVSRTSVFHDHESSTLQSGLEPRRKSQVRAPCRREFPPRAKLGSRIQGAPWSPNSLRGSSVKTGTIQRRLAWLLRKGDAHKSRSVNNFNVHPGPLSKGRKASCEPGTPRASRQRRGPPRRGRRGRGEARSTNTIYSITY